MSGSILKFERGKFIFAPAGGFVADTCVSPTLMAKKAGLVADGLQWHTRNINKAVLLRQFADESAERKFKKYFITEKQLPEQIIYPHHLRPMVHQLESAWHILGVTPAYDADEAGLGKTITAVMCMNTVPGKTLIICPPFLKYNWVDELMKWQTTPPGVKLNENYNTIAIIESGDCERADFNADTIILPDSLIDTPCIQHYLKDEKFTWLFVDEAHRFKTPDSGRTIALIGSDKDEKEMGKTYFSTVDCAERVAYLSGTPIPNGRPIELHPILNRTVGETFAGMSLEEYGKKYCGGRQVSRREGKRVINHWDFSGASNLKSFRKKLREKFMVRHLKKDVLDLAPKQRKLVFLDSPKELVKFETKMLKLYSMAELLEGKTKLGDMARLQREIGESKIAPALEYIKHLLDSSTDKLVIGAHHIDVVEGLHKALKYYGALKIRGGMDAAEKAEVVKKFQTKRVHRCVVGNIASMGVGNTLTSAPGVIVVEPSWQPGENEQLEDRIHRIGQAQQTYFRYLVLRGSLDERKLKRVMAKAFNINEVMG